MYICMVGTDTLPESKDCINEMMSARVHALEMDAARNDAHACQCNAMHVDAVDTARLWLWMTRYNIGKETELIFT